MTGMGNGGYTLKRLSCWALVGTVTSIFLLDEPIAVKIMQLLQSDAFLQHATANIPDALLILVCISTVAMWMTYFTLPRTDENLKLLGFLQLAATATPCSYLLKSVLKYAFGRTNTRLWLTSQVPLQFNWFNPAGGGGFPSGHMAVFAAFAAAVGHFYPKRKRAVVLVLLLLGIALIVTDYHFLSDVIAGAYVGFLVDYLVFNRLKR